MLSRHQPNGNCNSSCPHPGESEIASSKYTSVERYILYVYIWKIKVLAKNQELRKHKASQSSWFLPSSNSPVGWSPGITAENWLTKLNRKMRKVSGFKVLLHWKGHQKHGKENDTICKGSGVLFYRSTKCHVICIPSSALSRGLKAELWFFLHKHRRRKTQVSSPSGGAVWVTHTVPEGTSFLYCAIL